MDIISVKPNELRLGNYINIIVGDQRNFTTLVVSSIGSNIFAQTLNGKNVSGLYNDFAGIPLDEEWLLKFGFEKTANNCFTLDNNHIHITYNLDKNFFYLDDMDNFSPGCEFLHQLQNWYFMLTGEELTINENYK